MVPTPFPIPSRKCGEDKEKDIQLGLKNFGTLKRKGDGSCGDGVPNWRRPPHPLFEKLRGGPDEDADQSEKDQEDASLQISTDTDSSDSSLCSSEDLTTSETSDSSEEDEDSDFHELMAQYFYLVKEQSSLTFELDGLKSQPLSFPHRLQMRMEKYDPGLIRTTSLTSLKIAVNHSFGKGVDEITSLDEEAAILERVSFLLETIHSFALRSFEFTNEDSGCHPIEDKNRMDVWDHALQKLLNLHSSTLEKITIQSVGAQHVSEMDEFRLDEYPFAALKELKIAFTDAPDKKVSEEVQNDYQNFWVKLLQSRAYKGELHKLVWISSLDLSFSDSWRPIFYNNCKTLHTLHILEPPDSQTSLEDTFSSISCINFSDLQQLSDFYLKKSQCSLKRLDLLPASIKELKLEDVCLDTCELVVAIKNLRHLRTLRLLNNGFSISQLSQPNPSVPLQDESFGVNMDVIKTILNHRKLDQVFLYGCNLAEEDLNNSNSGKIRKTRSRFQKFKNFCSEVKAKISRSRPFRKAKGKANDVPASTIIMPDLKTFAFVDETEGSIRIN